MESSPVDRATPIVIREAQIEDAPEMARDEAPDQCKVCYLIAEERCGTIIAIAASRMAATDPDGTVAEVEALYVQPEYQRRGLGRRLLQQLAACLANKGTGSLHIGVLTANRDACQFYEFWRAKELIEIGRREGDKALDAAGY